MLFWMIDIRQLVRPEPPRQSHSRHNRAIDRHQTFATATTCAEFFRSYSTTLPSGDLMTVTRFHRRYQHSQRATRFCDELRHCDSSIDHVRSCSWLANRLGSDPAASVMK